MCAKRRLRSAWASVQSDQSLRWSHKESLCHELSSEDSDQTAHMSFCWFCHEAAHIHNITTYFLNVQFTKSRATSSLSLSLSLSLRRRWSPQCSDSLSLSLRRRWSPQCSDNPNISIRTMYQAMHQREATPSKQAQSQLQDRVIAPL